MIAVIIAHHACHVTKNQPIDQRKILENSILVEPVEWVPVHTKWTVLSSFPSVDYCLIGFDFSPNSLVTPPVIHVVVCHTSLTIHYMYVYKC